MLFGASYYPQHRDPDFWEYDLDNMAAAAVNALRVGDFAWSCLEPREGEYQFAWLDRFVALAQQRGIGLLLVPSLRNAPAWLIEKDPTIQMINESGVRLEYGSRYTYCINHPLLREKGLALSAEMARRYAGHPAVLGWHLDNEYGDEPDCHCDRCKEKWHAWLRARYGSIEALNRAWGTVFWGLAFNHFGQVPTPRLSKTYHNPALLLAWRRFRSECTVEIVGLHADVMRRQDPGKPITTNLQCLWNPRTDYYEMTRHLDAVGMNYYPAYGEDCRANTLGIAVVRGCLGGSLEIHELRNGPHAVPGRAANAPEPGEVERLSLHCVAHGADALYYFQWKAVPFGPEQSHGTPTGYDGKPKRVYYECRRIGEKLRRIAPLLEGTTVKSEASVLYDFTSRWATTAGGPEWVGPPNLYLDQARKVYNAVRSLGVNCDAVGCAGDLHAYKLLVVPMLTCVEDALAARLRAYVEQGGTLVWHPLSGIKNGEMEIYPGRLHPELEKLFGVDVREFTTAGEREQRGFTWNGARYAGELFFDLPERQGAAVVAEYAEGWLAGIPAITENRVGSGRAIYVTTFAEGRFYAEFLAQLSKEAGVRPILNAPVPPAIEIAERTAPDGRRFVFLINSTGKPQTLALPAAMHDIWADEPVRGEVPFAPWQVRVCR